VYIDDIILTGSSLALIQTLVASLQQQFAFKGLSPLHYFLGIEVHRSSDSLHLSQAKYLKEILTRAKMLNANLLPSPMCPKTILSKTVGNPFEDPHLYRSIVGALQYATLTRPDIAFSVNKVSQFMQSLSSSHWAAVKRILRYLKGILSHDITLKPVTSFILYVYSDANWAGSLDDRKSTTGLCLSRP
jgi:Reverse transcriptase (RNA-dependent DNA polymerase)